VPATTLSYGVGRSSSVNFTHNGLDQRLTEKTSGGDVAGTGLTSPYDVAARRQTLSVAKGAATILT
jgi:hypothetical protein